MMLSPDFHENKTLHTMASEQTPLLHYRLTGGSIQAPDASASPQQTGTSGCDVGPTGSPRRLGTLFGVVVPTMLSMFSVVLFLRLGFVVGQAGLLQGMAVFFLAYFIIGLTVLSVCAISTNGAIHGGGAYYMISRALGPEFGGSVGLLFFLANVGSSSVYLLGLVESVVMDFGQEYGGSLPTGYWPEVGYGSAFLLLLMLICQFGAAFYTRAIFLVLLIVAVTYGAAIASLFPSGGERSVVVVLNSSMHLNVTVHAPNLGTLRSNLNNDYLVDYTTGDVATFFSVFAVMFNGCTGIMAGSNMSGELKDPSRSIPRGTLTGVAFTYCIYNLTAFLISSSCPRLLLQYDYGFLRTIAPFPLLVSLGVYAAASSASLSCLIGASRVLYALACDRIFGHMLSPLTVTSRSGNPWVAVLFTWFLVQCVTFSGKLNSIAGIVTTCFLLTYASVNLACLAMEWASAPNFRPTFRLFSWHTCLGGLLGSLAMMFLVNPFIALVSLVALSILTVFLHYQTPDMGWGFISQALIYHQVRKYLLKLDIRKEHVKFWRPQILLLVANPRGACGLIRFLNHLKKGGLYVLGHVVIGNLDTMPYDPVQTESPSWLALIDQLDVKAFVEVTLAASVREGAQHLLRITGLGGMKPNTLVMGFYDDSQSHDWFLSDGAFADNAENRSHEASVCGPTPVQQLRTHFPPPRGAEAVRLLCESEYVAIINDAIKMGRNVCLARSFHRYPGPPLQNRFRLLRRDETPLQSTIHSDSETDTSDLETGASVTFPDDDDDGSVTIDVWPLDLLRPDAAFYLDVCGLLALQLACVLGMVPAWRGARLRVLLPVEMCLGVGHKSSDGASDCLNDATEQTANSELGGMGTEASASFLPLRDGVREAEVRLRKLLSGLRIRATVHTVPWDDVVALHWCRSDSGWIPDSVEDVSGVAKTIAGVPEKLCTPYIDAINGLLRRTSGAAAIRLLYLPRPPSDQRRYPAYLQRLHQMTGHLGPTLFVHGVDHVTCTDL
uniref:Solute carrier family 12 member 9 n=1 Tax=Eptatretus burgeri TaxID=7764 RepID=A0A8C4N283_EPTBU